MFRSNEIIFGLGYARCRHDLVLFDSAWSPPKIALHEERQIGLADECGRRSSADQLRGLAVLRPVIFETFARSARHTSAAALAGPWPLSPKDYHKENTLSTRNLPEAICGTWYRTFMRQDTASFRGIDPHESNR
jgi:hypothetical protein